MKPRTLRPHVDCAALFAWLLALLVMVVVLACTGCTSTETVVPTAVHSGQASFDGGAQTSGILYAQGDGFVVTASFRARYNALIDLYGAAFLPPLSRDAGLTQLSPSTWLIDAAHLERFLRMNTWRKSGRKPSTP